MGDNGATHKRNIVVPSRGRVTALVLGCILVVSAFVGVHPITPPTTAAVSDLINLSDTPSDPSSNPRIAVNGDNVYIVWQEGSTADIFLKRSEDNGVNFADPVNISNTPTASINPRIAVNGDNVYIVWQEGSTADIFLKRSEDNGVNFADPVNISNTPTASISPKVIGAGTNLFVLWEDSSEIFLKRSEDNGVNFADPVNISNNAGTSSASQVASSTDGTHLFVVWQDNTSGTNSVLYKKSDDGGNTFSTEKVLSINLSIAPQIAVSGTGEKNFVVWRDSVDSDIYFAKSSDGGENFDVGINLSGTSGPSNNPQLSITGDGSNILVAWEDSTPGTNDIFVKHSNDGGVEFGAVINVSKTDGISLSPQIAMSGDGTEAYAVWQDNTPGNFDIFISQSTDSALNFSDGVNISGDSEISNTPRIAISSDDEVLVVWHSTSGNRDVYLAQGISFVQSTITIGSVSKLSPRWGLDAVTVSGTTANEAAGDTVTVNWGDGSTTPAIAITSGSWTATHPFYESSSVGAAQIKAFLMHDDVQNASSDPIDITVTRHSTNLLLNQVLSVKQGEVVGLSGSIVDADVEEGLEGLTVTFDDSEGTELGISESITIQEGLFSSSGPSPVTSAAGWLVQAHFAGTDLYQESHSEIRSYDTASSTAQQYETENGNADLTDYGASVTFEHATAEGSVYVSECTPPDSDRYVAIEHGCLRVSSSVPIEAGTTASLIISFAEKTIPEGYGPDDISIFHNEPISNSIIDITRSRDTTEETVTAETSAFSDFILAVAKHDPKPDGMIRHQVFVGDNEVSLRNINDLSNVSSSRSFDKSSYAIGDSPIMTINDLDADMDPNTIDRISAKILSDTSDPQSIVISLIETGVSTGVFTGTFTLSDEVSSGTNLQVNTGDDIFVSYTRHNARVHVSLDGFSEAGVIDIGDYLQDDEPVPFLPISSAVDIKMLDAQFGPEGKATVTISYANTLIDGQEPAFLRIYHKEPDGSWEDITLADPAGHNLAAKTVTGVSTSLSPFVLGVDVGGPGGAGGGLARPGSGIVVDFVASLKPPTDTGGGDTGGGSGGTGNKNHPTKVVSVSEGSNIAVSSSTLSGDTLELTFESVSSSGGQVKVNEINNFEAYSELFDSMQENSDNTILMALANSGGASPSSIEYTTVSNLFDLEIPADLDYAGKIRVSLNYDEARVLAAGDEVNIRMLHYVEGGLTGQTLGWEDVTGIIDTEDNKITGYLDSLSPIVLAVTQDNTFAEVYFSVNPLERVQIVDSSVASTALESAVSGEPWVLKSGREARILASVENIQRSNQEFVVLVQVWDDEGIVQDINWQEGTLEIGQSSEVSVSWSPFESGKYTIKIFVWNSPDTSIIQNPLSEAKVMTVQVGD